MNKYNIIIQEALPELKTENGEVVQKAQDEYTLAMVFPTIYTHYIKANEGIMNLKNIKECIDLLKIITSNEGDVTRVKEILNSDVVDYEHIYSGAIFGEGLKRLIEFANDTNA